MSPSSAHLQAYQRLRASAAAGREDPQAFSRVGEAWPGFAHLIRAVASLRRGAPNAQIARDAREATAAAPTSSLVARMAAQVLFEVRCFDEALGLLERVEAVATTAAERAGAADQAYELCARIGRLEQAAAALERGLQLRPEAAVRWLEAAQFLGRHGCTEEALRHADQAAALDPHSEAVQLLRASLLLALRRPAEAAQAARQALAAGGDDPSFAALRAALEAGAFDDAAQGVEARLARAPGDWAVRLIRARLNLWRGDGAAAQEDAAAALRSAPEDPGALLVAGAAHALLQRPAEAAPLLTLAHQADPANPEPLLFRAELRLAAGSAEEALEDAHRARNLGRDDFAGYLVRAQLGFATGSGVDPVSGQVLSPADIDELAAGVAALVPGGLSALRSKDAGRAQATLATARAALRGNLSRTPTCITDGRLRRLVLAPSPRHAAMALLERVGLEPIASIEARFGHLFEAHPGSPLPWCYRGELYLWLGRMEEARADFERALALCAETRWAFIGLGAVELWCGGRIDAALRHFARSVEIAGVGASLPAYRGEALRRAGRLSEAQSDLEEACRLHPSRISAWVNLGLVRAARGDQRGPREAVAHLDDQAPGLLADAAHAAELPREGPGDEVRLLEAALQCMRGNRSSVVPTYFAKGDRLRRVCREPLERGRTAALHRVDAALHRQVARSVEAGRGGGG